MSKTKQWAYDLTMKVENVNMLGIDEFNVEEALTQ